MLHPRRLARAAFLFWLVAAGFAVDPAVAAEVSFADSFAVTDTVEEAGAMSESASPDWWVNSGGRLIRSGGTGSTIQGDLPASDRWAEAYAASNPVDTDDGLHPQNIFRLVTRRTWTTVQQTAWFQIRRTVMSASPNRNASNGLLFFNRYLDGNNLYYAGIRVDGAAVVKKKQAGVYTTLGYVKIYPGAWEKTANPNLLPIDRWIGVRSVIRTETNGSVRVTLSVADPVLGSGWRPVVDAVDSGASGAPIVAAGYAGIRTDFMDVEFEDYEAIPLGAESTPTPTKTPTPLPTATRTPTPLATSTPVATAPPAPTSTPQPTPTPSLPTPTAVPPSPTATFAVQPTSTPTRTPTSAPTPTPTSKRKGRRFS